MIRVFQDQDQVQDQIYILGPNLHQGILNFFKK